MKWCAEAEKIISEINLDADVEAEAKRVNAIIQKMLATIPKEKHVQIGKEVYQYLRYYSPRLGHLMHYYLDKAEGNKFSYGSESLSLYMEARESCPEYGAIARKYIKDTLGFLPMRLPNFAQVELAVRMYIKNTEAKLGKDDLPQIFLSKDRKNEAFLADMIIRMFGLENEYNNYHEEMHKKAMDTAKDIFKRLEGKTYAEKYAMGKQDGYELSKYSNRLVCLINYKMEAPKPFDYGSVRMNAFMEMPQNLPEFGEIARENITKVIGRLPTDDNDYAINELAVRIYCMQLRENYLQEEEPLKEFIQRLFGTHEDCDYSKSKKIKLN